MFKEKDDDDYMVYQVQEKMMKARQRGVAVQKDLKRDYVISEQPLISMTWLKIGHGTVIILV